MGHEFTTSPCTQHLQREEVSAEIELIGLDHIDFENLLLQYFLKVPIGKVHVSQLTFRLWIDYE